MADKGKTITFLIPKDETTRKQWLYNLPNTVVDSSQKRCMCSLRFKDTGMNTIAVCRGSKRKLKSLKKEAIPTVFTMVPYSTYSEETCILKRTTTMQSSETRIKAEWIAIEQNTESWLERDRFESLEALKEKGASDLLAGFRLTLDEDEMDDSISRFLLTVFKMTSCPPWITST